MRERLFDPRADFGGKTAIKWRASSTVDPDQVKQQWAEHPDAIPGIDLAKSGHVVVDGDRHGGPDGVAAVERLFTEHSTSLAAVPGVITPGEEGRRWAESKIKALTGGDKIAARFMRQDFFEYTPQFKLLIVGNHKPSLRTVDEAIRRRFNLIAFTVTIPPAERDEKLPDKLKAELPGILEIGRAHV